MKADMQRYRAVIDAATKRLRLGVDGPLCADALESVATELLAIAEAVERARKEIETIASMMDYTDASDYAVDLRAVGRLLAIGEDG